MATKTAARKPQNPPKTSGLSEGRAAFAAESATKTIVDALTRAITDHRLAPGAKLGEQKLADHFGVSRTLIRQALFQMVQNGLIRLEPARGAFVASPTIAEARQVFAVRRMVEQGLCRAFIAHHNPGKIEALREHLLAEQAAVREQDAATRVELLGDFHVLMAHLIGNDVLAEMLKDLISRCALVMLMYQSTHAAQDSTLEHSCIVQALADENETLAVRLMDEHLRHVEESLDFKNAQRLAEATL